MTKRLSRGSRTVKLFVASVMAHAAGFIPGDA